MIGLLRILVVSLLFILNIETIVFAQDKHKESGVGVGVDLRPFEISIFPGYFGNIENIPLELRQVISHPDDIWVYGTKRPLITIPENNLVMGGAISFSATLSGELKLYRLRLRSGPNYSWLFPIKTYPEGAEAIREVNQYGTSLRGTGTSLIYYKMIVRPVLKPGWTHELDFRIYNGWMAVGGFSVNYYKLAIETGYDRWNSFDSLENKEVSRNKLAKTYGGFGWRDINGEMGGASIFFFLGKSKTTAKLSNIAQGMQITYNDKYYISFVVSIHLF